MSGQANTTPAPANPSNQEDDIFVEMCRMVDNLLSENRKPEPTKQPPPENNPAEDNQPSDTESTESWTYYDYTDHRYCPYYDDNDSDIYDLMYECNHGEWGN
nr:X protein [Physostegia chlorotic mottle virus]